MKKLFFWFAAVAITITNISNGGECLIRNSTYNESEVHPLESENLTGKARDFHASIRLKVEDNPFGSDHRCGGALIAYNKVITAAQCLVDTTELHFSSLFPPSAFIVVIGAHNLSTKTPETFISDVEHFQVHTDFDSINFFNNIAILFLSRTVPIKHSTVTPVLMSKNEVQSGAVCSTTGWGFSAFGAGRSNVPIVAEVAVLPMSVCAKAFRYMSFEGMICVGQNSENKNICQADLGGPLICNGFMTGIVSYGLDCAKPESPAIFTDVWYFRHWINLTMSERSLQYTNGSSSLVSMLIFAFRCYLITLLTCLVLPHIGKRMYIF